MTPALKAMVEAMVAESFSDEVRALGSAVRSTVKSETFPLVSAHALAAIGLGLAGCWGAVGGAL